MGRFVNNTASGPFSPGTGSGVPREKAPFGQVTVIGSGAGDVVIMPITALYTRQGVGFQGIAVQSLGASVQVDYTLAPIDLAMNPDTGSGQVSNGIWITGSAVASGAVGNVAQKVVTALRFTFAGAGQAYVVGV